MSSHAASIISNTLLRAQHGDMGTGITTEGGVHSLLTKFQKRMQDDARKSSHAQGSKKEHCLGKL